MHRLKLHQVLDEQLTEMGYDQVITLRKGAIRIEIQVENGEPHTIVTERRVVPQERMKK